MTKEVMIQKKDKLEKQVKDLYTEIADIEDALIMKLTDLELEVSYLLDILDDYKEKN